MMEQNDNRASGVYLKRRQGYTKDVQKCKLFCPMCSLKMEPLIVDTTVKEDTKEESIWWTCSGLRSKTCNFPLSMPSAVFWTTRNAQQIEDEIVPMPNFHLLPEKYHHLYDAFFKPIHANQQTQKNLPPVVDKSFKRKSGPGSFPQRPSKLIRTTHPTAQPIRRVAGKQQDQEITMDRCLELVASHVPYLPDIETISARLGKDYQASSQISSGSNSIEWSEMDLNSVTRNPRQFASPNENLPSCSSESSNSLEQAPQSFPEGHPLHVPTFGDPELDRLCTENLAGLLKSKELKKRRKKPRNKPVEQVAPQSSDPNALSYPELDDDFEFHNSHSWYYDSNAS
ncbi:hypothetical protein M3Y97_00353300 [Aphelenchoides bicaudatus]|nr:hypothetical protein M3Y97_00353300 [Aphelenchoides bicaudatus]